jgi:hypothetical protein
MICAMKSKHSFARNVLLVLSFLCAIFISAAAQAGRSSRYVPPGRLTVDRVPNFGWNLAFHLQIDGRSVANVAQGHSYSTWLPAGPHVLTVYKVPRLGFTEPTSTIVNIEPGANHVYTAMWDSNLVVLRPAGAWLTPGHVWQLPTSNSWAKAPYYQPIARP